MRLVKFRWPRTLCTVPRQPLLTVGAASLVALSFCLSLSAAPAQAKPSIAQYDQPKYPADFTHFDYANPDAPANGTLSFENYNELQTYDSLNPFLVRGAPAPDIQNLMFDTLMQRSCRGCCRSEFGDVPYQSRGTLFQRRSDHRR
jgi:microcin C transport system substrate-binding protein